jgi:hypothetical protein
MKTKKKISAKSKANMRKETSTRLEEDDGPSHSDDTNSLIKSSRNKSAIALVLISLIPPYKPLRKPQLRYQTRSTGPSVVGSSRTLARTTCKRREARLHGTLNAAKGKTGREK